MKIWYQYKGQRSHEIEVDDIEQAKEFLDETLVDGFLCDGAPREVYASTEGFSGTLYATDEGSWWDVVENKLGDFFCTTCGSRDEYEKKFHPEQPVKIFLSRSCVDTICDHDCDLGSAENDTEYELMQRVLDELDDSMRRKDGSYELSLEVFDFVIDKLDWYASAYWPLEKELKELSNDLEDAK